MPKHSTFDQKIDSANGPITLYCVISPDNAKQRNANFGEFVALVNENRGVIKHVIIIDG